MLFKIRLSNSNLESPLPELRELLKVKLSSIDIQLEAEKCLETCIEISENELKKHGEFQQRITFYFGPSGIYTLGCHIHYLNKKWDQFKICLNKVMNTYKIIQQTYQKQFCEVLYGIPGFLYNLLYLQKHCNNKVNEHYPDFW